MNSEQQTEPSLREMELEVEAGLRIEAGPLAADLSNRACRTRQSRRKRSGQFWTKTGLRHLDVLEESRDNGHWEQLWLNA